jgi:hypothetical protein
VSISYWAIMVVALILCMIFGVAVAVTFGFDPYACALLAGGLLVLRETWWMKKRT